MTTTEIPSVCFWTPTDIDPRSWTVMGMTAAVCDNPIKAFGTGMKYSLSILVRNGHEVEIFSHGKHYVFGLTETEFRGKKFEQVTCNGEPLPFTTEYGKNWTLEGAYRELVSNCMDEGGIHFSGDKLEGGTSIVVRGAAFHEILKNHDKIFIGEREPLAETQHVRLYKGDGNIFYRGVKIGRVEGAIFDYEMIKNTEITEDRTLKNEYSLKNDIGYAFVSQLEDEKLIKQLVMCEHGFEADCDWDWTWSDTLKKVISEVWTDCPTKLSSKLIRLKITRMPGERFTEQEMSEDQVLMLDKAKEFLKAAGYEVTAPVQLIHNTDDNNIAFAYNSKIYLTERSFAQGLFYLVTVLFEERSHVIGHDDYTRSFQSYLIKELITHARKHLKMVL